MSAEGVQNSYLNYGFDLMNEEESVLPASRTTEDGITRSRVENSLSHQETAVTTVDVQGGHVHYFRRNPNPSEQTSLLPQEKEQPTITYFVKSSNTDEVFKRFKQLLACVALSDCLHKIVYFCLVADFILFAETYLQCDARSSIIFSYAVVSCCLLMSAAFLVCIDLGIKRFRIILVGFIGYIIGISALSGLNASVSNRSCRWWSILALFLICFGEASTRTALPEFTIMSPSQNGKEKQKAYAWKLHWASNLLIILSVAVVTAIDQNLNFETGYYVSTAVVVLSFALFLVPLKHYKQRPTSHSGSLKVLHNILAEANEVKKRLQKISKSSTNFESANEDGTVRPSSWIDYAMSKHGGTYEDCDVNRVKCLYDMAVLFLFLIPYWIIHAQCYTTYYHQGLHLDTRVAGKNFPVAWMNLFTVVTVMLATPFLDKVIYPALEARDWQFPITWRIILGMIFGCISVIVAGCVERSGIFHKHSKEIFHQSVGKLNVTAVKLNIFVQLPQYFLLGLSEVLSSLTALNAAHRLCTGGFRRLATVMYFISMSAGHLLGLVIISFQWYPPSDYFVDSTVQNYFFFLAVLMAVNIIVFAVVIYRMVDIPSRLHNS